MDIENVIDRFLPYLRKWFFTSLLFIPAWILVEKYWLTLGTNINFAHNYPLPFFYSPFHFVMDNVTLILHEAGHTIFGVFNWRFLTILGGTLMQLLIPFSLFISTWWKRQRYLSQAFLFWLGFGWLRASAYCADAYYQQLPLIGGLPKSAHDYTNMLSMLNILDKYMTVAWTMFGIGVSILLLSLIFPILERKEYETIDLKKELKKSGFR